MKPELTIDGIKRCIENANDYYKEARLLHKHKRLPRAIALTILGIEEIGKAELIAQILIEEDQQEKSTLKKKFSRHPEKIERAAFASACNSYFDNQEIGVASLIKNSPFANLNLDKLKQACFYVDYDSEAGYSSPKDLPISEFLPVIKGLSELLRVYFPFSKMTFKSVEELRKILTSEISALKEEGFYSNLERAIQNALRTRPNE